MPLSKKRKGNLRGEEYIDHPEEVRALLLGKNKIVLLYPSVTLVNSKLHRIILRGEYV